MEESYLLSLEKTIGKEINELLPDALAEEVGETIVGLDNEPYPDGCYNFMQVCMALRISTTEPGLDDSWEEREFSSLILYEHTHKYGIRILGIIPDKFYALH